MAYGSASWTTAPLANPLTLTVISLAGNELPEERYVWTGTCEGLPFAGATESAPMPGCDVMINIPEGSVMGAFTADAAAYWRPGDLTAPLITLPAGKTAWVIGQDATGEYYKIVWVCSYLWVPKDTMGPNFDAVWDGAPLPDRVVE